MADQPQPKTTVTLWSGGSIIRHWHVKNAKVSHLYGNTIAFRQEDTDKIIQVSGTFTIETSNVPEDWFAGL